MDYKKLCSYDYRSRLSNTSYPTTEWSLQPYDRLRELIHTYNCTYFEYMSNFNDFYTLSVIRELGANLFTLDGYIRIFNNSCDDYDMLYHVFRQIHKVCENVSDEDIWSWIKSSRKKLSLAKKYQ